MADATALSWSDRYSNDVSTTYRLQHDGSDLVVETWVEGKHNHARLLVDGDEVATGHTDEVGRVDLSPGDGPHARVGFWWTGRVSRVALVEDGGLKPALTPFEPPSGTRAARSYAFQQRHPALWSARHVALNVLGTVVAVLGISALLRAMFEDLLPSLDLPELHAPQWLRYLDPFRYLEPLFRWVPELSLDWLPDLAPWVKYVVGFLFACAVAAQEYRRRSKPKRDQEDADADRRP